MQSGPVSTRKLPGHRRDGLARKSDEREDDGSDDALQRPDNEDPEEGGERPQELQPPDLEDRRELVRPDQGDRLDDHDRGEHRLRQMPEEGCEDEHRRDGRRRGDERGDLGIPSDGPDDRRLRGAAVRPHRAQNGAAEIGRACREELAIGPDRRIGGRGERATGGDRLG